MNKTILFVVSELFGTRAGSFRQERWVKAFLQDGYCCIIYDNLSLMGEYRVFESIHDFEEFRSFIRNSVKSSASVKEGTVINIFRKFKHFFLLEVFNPFIVIHFFHILIKLRFRAVNIIFSSSPPFSTVIIGFLYKKCYPRTKFIIDFRDEWSDHPFLPSKTFISRLFIEKTPVRSADLLITVSNFIRNRLEHKHKAKVDLVYNAPDIYFKDYAIKENVAKASMTTVLYTGSLPNSSFDVLKLKFFLDEANKKFGTRIVFQFVGACKSLEELGCSENVMFLSHTKLNEVRALQKQCDILLFLGANFPDNGGIVSAKIFEYLQSSKPILPLFVQLNSDINQIINSACNSCPTIFEVDEFCSLLEKMFLEKDLSCFPKLKNIEFLEFLIQQYPKYVKELSLLDEE